VCLISDLPFLIYSLESFRIQNMKKYFTILTPFLSVAFFLAGCTGSTAVSTPDQLATIVAKTLTAVAVNVPPILTTPETAAPPAASTSTAESAGIRYVYTQADNVNLRVNPGRLFKVSRVLAKSTKLQVLGASPGEEWLNVLNEEGINGWVGVDFVSGGFDGGSLPLSNPTNVQLVAGRVLDANDNPVTGIVFSIKQAAQQEEATTDETGIFYAYLPPKFSGAWTVSFLSVACRSNTMDANCKCVGGTCGNTNPEAVTVTLPLSTPLSFVWR